MRFQLPAPSLMTSPGEFFQGRAVLPAQLRCGTKGFDLGFEWTDTLVHLRQLRRLCCRETGPFAPVDLILAQPFIKRGDAVAELDSDLGDQLRQPGTSQ